MQWLEERRGKIERGSVSMVRSTGVTVATGTGSPASHAVSSYFVPLLLFFYPIVLIPLLLSLSLTSFCISLTICQGTFLSGIFFLCTWHSSPSSSHIPDVFLTLFFCHSHEHTLCNLVWSCADLLLFRFLCLSCVGWRGNSSLHPSGSASDPAAVPTGGESRQERFPVSQEVLP